MVIVIVCFVLLFILHAPRFRFLSFVFLPSICFVEIPIEIRLGIFLEESEQFLFGLVEHVESNDGKLLVLDAFFES